VTLENGMTNRIPVLILLLLLFSRLSQAESSEINWIWDSDPRSASTTSDFTRSFVIDGEVKRAQLKITADFASVHVLIGKQKILELEAFDPPLTLDIRKYLKQGNNKITFQAKGVTGPSAIAALISIEFQDDAADSIDIPTDDSWKVDGKLRSFGIITRERWMNNHLPEINADAEYNQWREALPGDAANNDDLEGIGPLPKGFRIEIIHRARKDEGSWVSMAIDGKGRLILAREDNGLLRMEIPKDKSTQPKLETINDTLKECRGIAFHEKILFANANNSKGFYQLRDTNDDDHFDEVTLLQATEGGAGHGRNDLAIGPDGWIHAIQGDSVTVPENSQRLTVPEPDAPKELGHWLRTKGDGKSWEVRARGLRNPYGIAFNPHGEAFTYDADNEGDVGLPFYRPTRINHLVSGANYGWHQQEGNTRNMTVYSPDSVPSTYDVGRGSPTAVKFGTRSNFPYPWKEALFALDWAYGRIIAVHLTPRGASYYGSGEIFLEGRPLNVTDLDFDSEGNMLFITGGRKTQSTLYRVSYAGDRLEKPKLTAQQSERSKFSTFVRGLGHQHDRLNGKDDPLMMGVLLKSHDPWMRNVARIWLEKIPINLLKERTKKSSSDLAGLTTLLALTRKSSDEDRKMALARSLGFPNSDWSRSEKLILLRICELTPQHHAQKVRDTLEAWLPDINDPVNRELCRVLCPLGSKKAVSASLSFIENSSDQMERLHYLEALSHAPDSGWTSKNRESFFRKLGTAKRFSKGDRFITAFFESLEKRALSAVTSDESREKFTDILVAAAKPEAVKSDNEKPVIPRKFVKHWTMSDFSESDLKGTPNLETGRNMFQAALCNRCHVCGKEGRAVGPDLTQVGRRFSKRDLLLSIIEPSQVVAEVHRNVVVKLKDGKITLGRIALDDFRKSTIYISTNAFLPDELTEIPKSSIDSLEESPVSPMPPALLNTLTKKEILDLLEWLKRGGP